MANVFANFSFDYHKINMNLLVSKQTDFFFYDNVYEIYNGKTYQDVAVFEYYDNGYVYAFFGGNNVVFNSDYSSVLSGTATGFIEEVWNGSSWSALWGVENFSYSAVSLANAILSPSTADDFTLLSNVLSGDDTFSMSAYADVVRGYAGNDLIYGNAGNDQIIGDSGNDTLNGGTGSDTLVGGAGNDTYYVDNTGDRVYETTTTTSSTNAGGTDKVNSSISFDLSAYTGVSFVENLTLTGSSAINATGNALANILVGNSGANVINGKAGADTMLGGAGNDTYYLDHTGDRVYETSTITSGINAGGTDTVLSYLSAYTLGSFVEIGRVMSAGTASLTGNSLNNVIYAGKGSNVLAGGSGTDTLSYAFGANGTTGVKVSLATTAAQATGGSGTDTISGFENLTGSANSDSLTGGSGANLIRGGNGNDTVIGGSGNDTLYGDAGNDLLRGGTGKDSLTGGAGKDIFDFNTLAEMGITSTTWDVITDFVRGHDKIDLSTLDANTATTTNDAFNGALIASSVKFTKAGQLKFASGVLYGNTDTDSAPEFAIALTGVTALSAADFVL